ncbi:hypothetical protein SASPL_145593 [Salvia splendens]|uniref:Bifunctional inhibitor/plant lipid transfer protein/seed storage helical domain-containing protein n=1 Tax=Salvia splendens TaxID=180675 RepID=A0A8X8WHD1_SALSN|nr:non-specific lipid-transfer protein-like [Salvia splendens]KAG6395002.1 hypothetical protein SASPL_145593 [Salvia splendens]
MSRFLHILALLLFVSKYVVSAPSCVLVVKDVAPCLEYLQGKGASPECCQGVNDLRGYAKTKEDRTAICSCVKQALSSYKYDPKLIPLLPKKCGSNLELPPVDKDYDCSKA